MNEGIEPKYKHLTPFKRCIIQNFPFIEADFDALTNYGLLSKIVEYLNNVITSQNTVQTNVEALNNAFIDLISHIDNYFDDLNVQEEINNKLDAMVESGEFQELVGDLLVKKLDYYRVDNTWTQAEIQELFDIERAKIIEFADGTYNFDTAFRLNSNTKIILNNANLVSSYKHLFYNFKSTDTSITGYNGSHNIEIVGGKVNSCFSFIHGKNILFKNIYFYHVENDHCMEICACSDVKVEGCTFEGVVTQTSDRQYVENVQIENATYTAFPWLSEGSDTYDNTACTNIKVDNCVFKQTDIITYRFYAGVGGHTYVDDYPHTNIQITNNTFTDSISYCIRLHNIENVLIDNNILKETNVVNPDGEPNNAINIHNGANNLKITNNIIDGFAGAQIYLANDSDDILIDSNTFMHQPMKARPSDSDSTQSILFRNIRKMVITNNRFIDNASAQTLQISGSSPITGQIIFANNTILVDSSITEIGYWPNRMYYAKTVIFKDNSYTWNPASAGTLFRGHQNNQYITLSGNDRSDISGKFFDPNGYVGSWKGIKGVLTNVWNGNVTSLTEQTLSKDYTQFNRCVVICGDGGNTNYVKLASFTPTSALDARTCVAPLVNGSGNEVGLLKVTFNNDDNKTITASSSLNAIKLRYIFFVNE